MGVRVCLCMRLPNDYTNTSLPCLCRFLPKIPHLTPGFPSFAISSSRSSSRRRWSASVNGGSATPSSNGQRGAAGKMPRCGRWGSGRVDGVGMAQNQGILNQKWQHWQTGSARASSNSGCKVLLPCRSRGACHRCHPGSRSRRPEIQAVTARFEVTEHWTGVLSASKTK